MKIEELLREDEGMQLKPYRDTSGKLTIGIGRNLDDVGISQKEADFMLVNDIERVKLALIVKLPIYGEMPEDIKLVLENMAFNLGIGGLLQFKKFLSFLAEGDYENASSEVLDSRWAKQVGKRAARLSNIIKNQKS